MHISRSVLSYISALALALALSACGFQLRGSNLETMKTARVHVKSSGANALANEIKRQLEYAEIQVAQDRNQADYVIEVGHEDFRRALLSVSTQTGKGKEYEITYTALLSITGPGGKIFLQNEKLLFKRDLTFDEGAVLAKSKEEGTLHNELMRHAAETVLRRLQAVTR